jgi:hypothetical protein
MLVGETAHTLTRNTNKGQKANTNEGKGRSIKKPALGWLIIFNSI